MGFASALSPALSQGEREKEKKEMKREREF